MALEVDIKAVAGPDPMGVLDDLMEKFSQYGALAPAEIDFLLDTAWSLKAHVCCNLSTEADARALRQVFRAEHRLKETKAERRKLSPRARFAILRRDGFRCRYCGESAATTALEVDHVLPVSEGGTDSEDNLATACFSCNRGKADGTHLDRGGL